MLHIEWWHHAAYGYMWQLAASGFAWEYLRRNDEYRHDCRTLALAGFNHCPNFSGSLPVFRFDEVEDAEQLAA